MGYCTAGAGWVLSISILKSKQVRWMRSPTRTVTVRTLSARRTFTRQCRSLGTGTIWSAYASDELQKL